MRKFAFASLLALGVAILASGCITTDYPVQNDTGLGGPGCGGWLAGGGNVPTNGPFHIWDGSQTGTIFGSGTVELVDIVRQPGQQGTIDHGECFIPAPGNPNSVFHNDIACSDQPQNCVWATSDQGGPAFDYARKNNNCSGAAEANAALSVLVSYFGYYYTCDADRAMPRLDGTGVGARELADILDQGVPTMVNGVEYLKFDLNAQTTRLAFITRGNGGESRVTPFNFNGASPSWYVSPGKHVSLLDLRDRSNLAMLNGWFDTIDSLASMYGQGPIPVNIVGSFYGVAIKGVPSNRTIALNGGMDTAAVRDTLSKIYGGGLAGSNLNPGTVTGSRIR